MSDSDKIWEARQFICGKLFFFIESLINFTGNLDLEFDHVEAVFDSFLPKLIRLLQIWLGRYIKSANVIQADSEVEDTLNLVNVN